MKSNPRQDRTWLLAVARSVAVRLKQHFGGTQLRIRLPRGAAQTNTNGWSVIIGDLGKSKPRLEIWLDKFSGYSQRKLFACFFSRARPQLLTITKRVARKLWPARIVTTEDTERQRFLVLSKRLARSEFNAPILEKYKGGSTFYGIYDPTRETVERVSPHFITRAAAFFEDVARALPHAKAQDEERDVFPQVENRKRVRSHLVRERSKLLAAECKIRDDYQCQVCNLRPELAYGILGRESTEAHHLVPLSRLREDVRTKLEDLATVCANCHRVLHRMDGKSHDITKLRALVRKNVKKRA